MERTSTIVVLVLLALTALVFPVAAQQDVDETPVRIIELTGPASAPYAELSGMAWYGDYLVLMTEDPYLFADDDSSGAFFALEKADILAYLADDDAEPLAPFRVPIYGPNLYDAVSGFGLSLDGLEAITFVDAPNAFADDQVFLTVEADTVPTQDPPMRSYLIWGRVIGDLEGISLALDDFIPLPVQTSVDNKSYESLLHVDGGIVAIYEYNGVAYNDNPYAIHIDLATGETRDIPMSHLEFRLTDVTSPDEDGVFWASNFYFPGDEVFVVEDDPLYAAYGLGASQPETGPYERLVQFRYTDTRIELLEAPPVQLEQLPGSTGRNWEGIVRLDDLGVLLVTDRFPVTTLAFAELPAD